jgi:hypothetical protein
MINRATRSIALAALLLAVPAALSAQDHQHGQKLVRPDLPVDQNEYVQVVNHEEDRTAEFVIGPLDLPNDMPHLRLPIQMAEIPVDGWLHGFDAQMVDGEGNAIPMETLHHVNFIDPDKRDLFSPIARRVLAAGRETSKKELPGLLGYPIQAGDRMIISAMFANGTGSDYPEAYLRVRLFYSLEEDGFMQPRDVYPFYLDVMGPVGLKDFPVPPGKTVKSWEGTPAIEGRILGIGGHLHNYATVLRLEDVTESKTIWEAEPEVDQHGAVTGVPEGRFWWRGGIKIETDHVYRIYVEYENPTERPTPDGGMGEIGGIVWAAKDVQWPEFNRDNPDYVADLINTLEAPEKLGGHGHGAHDMGGEGMKMEGPEAGENENGQEEHGDHGEHGR